jgi:hypothetical protein
MDLCIQSRISKIRNALYAFLRRHWIPLGSALLSIAALLCSARSCVVARSANAIARTTAYLDIEPTIRAYVRGEVPDADLIVVNDGPLPATSLSVSRLHEYIQVGIEQIYAVSPGIRPAPDPIFDTEGTVVAYAVKLDPKKHITVPLYAGGYFETPTSSVEVIEVGLQYYRESDLHEFKKDVFFFQFGGHIFDLDQFRKHPASAATLERYQRHPAQVAMRQNITRLKYLPLPDPPPPPAKQFTWPVNLSSATTSPVPPIVLTAPRITRLSPFVVEPEY